MKLAEANNRFNLIANTSFQTLFTEAELATIKKNKGRSGQLLELALGLHLTNVNKDFEDGELKTNKCDAQGNPQETIAITQISSHIEDLIEKVPFEESWLFDKIGNILYIPVSKEGEIKDWMFLPSIHINLKDEKYKEIFEQLKVDYNFICNTIKDSCKGGENLHTINGKFLQIRTKDSAPYHPIYSSSCGRNISSKNFAFYFKKDFIKAIKGLNSL